MKRSNYTMGYFRSSRTRRVKQRWSDEQVGTMDFGMLDYLGEIAEHFCGKDLSLVSCEKGFSDEERLLNNNHNTSLDNLNCMKAPDEVLLISVPKEIGKPKQTSSDPNQDKNSFKSSQLTSTSPNTEREQSGLFFTMLFEHYKSDYPRVVTVFVNTLERFQRRQIDQLALSSILQCLFHDSPGIIKKFYNLAFSSTTRRREKFVNKSSSSLPPPHPSKTNLMDYQNNYENKQTVPPSFSQAVRTPGVEAKSNETNSFPSNDNGGNDSLNFASNFVPLNARERASENNKVKLLRFLQLINSGLAPLMYHLFTDKMSKIRKLFHEGNQEEAQKEFNSLIAFVPDTPPRLLEYLSEYLHDDSEDSLNREASINLGSSNAGSNGYQTVIGDRSYKPN